MSKANMHVCVCCFKMREKDYLAVEIGQNAPFTFTLTHMKMMFIFILLL